MSDPAREPSMDEILASIRKVIDDEKQAPSASSEEAPADEDVLELEQLAETEAERVVPPVELGPPLVSEDAAEASRRSLSSLQQVAAANPQPPANPLEAMVRDMLRPVLKDWLEKHLPEIVEEHVKREIARITGTML